MTMGFRAHQRVVSKCKYDDSDFFNYCDEEVCNLIERFGENSLVTDDTGYPLSSWEIDPDDIKKCIEGIKSNYKLDDVAFEDYTYGDVVKVFEMWLKKQELHRKDIDDEFIRIDWF